mmetsp:Transcript_4814/g.14510  ORF Transcript_4814/g.14510 Transcript_4814/m.14510 type:complete len:289 (+) Transcript_4814:106-972(+)
MSFYGVMSTPPLGRELSRFLSLRRMKMPTWRPYVWTMTVASVDGRISLAEDRDDLRGGGAVASAGGKFRSDVDQALMHYGWESADAVLTTGAILRAEPKQAYHTETRCAVLTASGNIDVRHPVFLKKNTVVYTTTAVKKALVSTLPGFCSVYDLPSVDSRSRVDMTTMLVHMRESLGIKKLDVTAGGATIGSLLHADLVDEMRLTIAMTVRLTLLNIAVALVRAWIYTAYPTHQVLGQWSSSRREREPTISSSSECPFPADKLPLMHIYKLRTDKERRHAYLRLRVTR